MTWRAGPPEPYEPPDERPDGTGHEERGVLSGPEQLLWRVLVVALAVAFLTLISAAALSRAGSTTNQASAAAGPLTRVVDLGLVRASAFQDAKEKNA